MIRICFLSLLLATSTISVAQRTLKLKDVMLFCGNSKLAVSEDWNAIDAENLCIQEVTEKRHYKIYGQTRLLDVDYWTWKDERWGNGNARGYSYLRESNSGLATSVFFNTSEFVMLLENNTNMYFFIELDNLLLSFSKNEDEGIMSVSPTGNFLRNRNYGNFDYVLIPPKRKAEVSFFGLESPIIFPTSLPSKTLIQYSIFSFAFPTNPWDTIKEKISEEDRNGDKIFTLKDDTYYFTTRENFISTMSFGFNRPIGVESRYHCVLH